MRLIIIKILFTLLCLCLLSCKKKIDEDYRSEFIGNWYSAHNTGADFWYDIKVDSNSYATYTSHTALGGGDLSKIHGIARANDKHFKIGRIYSFKIIEYPHKIDTTSSSIYVQDGLSNKKANWEMILKGPILHGGDGTYFRADY